VKSNNGKFKAKSLIVALGLFLMLPAFVAAQDGYGRQDDNYRRERRQDRREDRRERRQERRSERRGRNWDNYGNYGGSSQLRQTALNAGYNNGMEAGRKDRQRNKDFDFQDESNFQKATKDYSSRLGDRDTYRQYFREAFATGYEDGYRGY
jgi:hypothetical protein